MALLGNVVVRRPGDPEVYAETADLHERFSPGSPGWGHPPLEDEVRMTDEGWGLVTDPGSLFGPTIVRCGPPRVFRTAKLVLIHAASCRFRYSSWASCGVR